MVICVREFIRAQEGASRVARKDFFSSVKNGFNDGETRIDRVMDGDSSIVIGCHSDGAHTFTIGFTGSGMGSNVKGHSDDSAGWSATSADGWADALAVIRHYIQTETPRLITYNHLG